MEDAVLDDLVDFLQTYDDLTLPASLMLTSDNDLATSTFVPAANSPIKTPPARISDSDGPTKARPQRSKDAIRRSEYRKRQKAEKEALRQEINDLSSKLDNLQSSSGEGGSSSTTDAALSTCLWRAIASRQKEHRRAAEDEQSHLRAIITSHATLIQDLCGFLCKRTHDKTIATDEFGTAPRLQKRMRLEATDSALFEKFLQELKTLYYQTDQVLSACKMVSAFDVPLITKHKDGTTEYCEHAERQVLPLSFERVFRSIWHIAQLQHRQEDREIYEGVEDPENTMAIKYRITSRRMGETVSLLQRVVMRQYPENNRVVAVWKVFTEGEGLFRGMHSDKTGWAVLRPSTNEAGACTGTILDTCFRLVPMHLSNMSTCAPIVEDFIDMVILTEEEESQHVRQGLENMLLDDELDLL